MLLRTGGHTYRILWCVCHEGAGEQFHTGNTLRQTVIHKQGRLIGDRFGVTRRGYCYSTDKNDDPKCARTHTHPKVLSLKGSPKFCSLHPQGSKDQDQNSHSSRGVVLVVRVLNPKKSPWAAPQPQVKGFPPQTSCSKENHTKKGAITWSGQGLWTYMVMVQKLLWTEASYYLGTLCVDQGVLPFSFPP